MTLPMPDPGAFTQARLGAVAVPRRAPTELQQLTVTPLDRFLAAHLLAGAVEEVYGVSAPGVVRRVLDHQR